MARARSSWDAPSIEHDARMSFLTALALLVGLLAAAPVAAHLLRRRRASEVALPTASLLAATPPTARKRSALEDRALLGVRVLAVLLLAILGATPFISCKHVALLRKDGASVAIVLVLDDSLSMRAKQPGSDQTRFDRAKRAAHDLIDGAEPGDSFAIVLAGTPARVQLAPTTDAAAARSALDEVMPSDRSTDLAEAVALASELVRNAPQPDRRVALLSDLADGDPEGQALSTSGEIALWYPLADLEARGEVDCGIIGTTRRESAVDVVTRCSSGNSAAREVEIVTASVPAAVIGHATLEPGGADTLTIKIPEGSPDDLDARLSGTDAIAADDSAPVARKAKDAAIAVVADAASSHVETGGPPPVEQAFAALELGPAMHPLSGVPEHSEELSSFAGLVLDDPPGLTPEERKSVASWVEQGGVLLLSLGRKATAAPLGAGFGTLVPGVVRWASTAPKSAKVDACGFFGPSAPSLADVAPHGRVQLQPEATEGAEVLCAFEDDEPLFVRRHLGKGLVFVVALPFDLENSELAVRPAFLTLLDRFVETVRSASSGVVLEVGQRFTFAGSRSVEGEVLPIGEQKSIRLEVPGGAAPRVDAPRIGRYSFVVDGSTDLRIAVAAAREIDLRPRALAESARDPSLGGEARSIDASPYAALALLGVLLLELMLRLLTSPGQTRPLGSAPDADDLPPGSAAAS